MHSLSDCNIRQHKPCQSCQDQRMGDIKENGSANKRLASYSVLTLCLGKSVSQLAESKKVKEHLEEECRGVWLLIKSSSCSCSSYCSPAMQLDSGHQGRHMVLTYLAFSVQIHDGSFRIMNNLIESTNIGCNLFSHSNLLCEQKCHFRWMCL